MRRGRMFLYLVLILVVGLIVVFFVAQQVLQSPETSPESIPTPTPVPMVDVVIVTQNVRRGQILDESVVSLVPYQKDLYIETMFTSLNQVVGQRARLDMAPGLVVMESMVAQDVTGLTATGSDAALLIPAGKVAISIPIDRFTSVGYAVQRGDHVNVIATLLLLQLDDEFQTRLPNYSSVVSGPSTSPEGETILSASPSSGGASSTAGRVFIDPELGAPFYLVPSEPQRARLVSQTLLQDVIVLHVGEFPDPEAPTTTPTPDPNAPPPSSDPNQPQPAPVTPERPNIITLIVSPQDAVAVTYLLNNVYGTKLSLVLRGAGDDSTVPIDAVNLAYLLEQYNIPVPVKLPYGIEPSIDLLYSPDEQKTLQSPVVTPVP